MGLDPFVVISFDKKVFRTRVIRHSLNPIWDKKLLFHARRYETFFKVNLTVLDWDKLSANDNIGDVNFDVKELIESTPQPDPETGLYKFDEDGGAGQLEGGMKDYTCSWLRRRGHHTLTISFCAKYQPYAALCQRFWHQYIAQYDSDDVGQISHLELTSMLNLLSSTLTPEIINSFWTKFGKKMEEDTLIVDQVITCLEEELTRLDSEKRRVHKQEGGRGEEGDEDSSISATPILGVSNREGKELQVGP